MAPDVMRHRLVLSFEALSEDITSDAILATILGRVPPPAVPLQDRAAAMPEPSRRRPVSAGARPPAPRLAGRAAPGRAAPGRLPEPVPGRRASTSPRCASTSPATTCGASTGTSPPGRRPVRPRVPRGPRDHGLVPARPQPVRRLRHGRRRTAEADGAGGLRGDAGAPADAPRQPRRGDVLRERGGPDPPRRRRPRAGPADRERPHGGAAARARAGDGPRGAVRGGAPPDQAPLDGRHRVGLHQRAGLGEAAPPAQPPPRGARGPPRRPARGGAARTSARSWSRTPRRASSSWSTRTTRSSGAGSRPPRRPARPTSALAFGRAGIDAVTLSTDDDLVRAIVRMATRRKRRRRSHA